VRITGKFHLKDYKLIGASQNGDRPFDKTVVLTPDAPHAEFTLSAAAVGDVSAALRVRLDRNADNSIFVSWNARLFDEKDAVATTGAQFNVLKDASLHWGAVHLVDYHPGDPDTGDIDFSVSNVQA
jgi:hypothetical protein